jgi:hypothetical protein
MRGHVGQVWKGLIGIDMNAQVCISWEFCNVSIGKARLPWLDDVKVWISIGGFHRSG